jgi:SulP family sulfate permease
MIAALMAIPVELVFGVFAVSPLGPDYAQYGIRAALWGCILGGILVFLLRGNGGMLTGTRTAPALILGTLAAHLVQLPTVQSAPDPHALVLVLLLLCTCLVGVFQWLLGLVRVGQLLKYVPYPVTAGLMLGVALLLLMIGFRPALGIESAPPFPDALGAWHPASLVVTLVTLSLCILAPRWTTRIPNSILALLGGTLLHHVLSATLGPAQLGTTTTSLDSVLPELSLVQSGMTMGLHQLFSWLPLLTSYALAIAALASLETLLCVAAIGAEKSARPDANRELRTQGMATLITGMLGGTPSISNLARVKLNLSTGARTSLSGLAYAFTLIMFGTYAGSLTGMIPHSAIAAILIYYAFGMIDDGTRRLLRQVATQYRVMEPQQYRILLANTLVILAVALVVVFGDMMKAMAIGVLAAVFLFVRSNTKPPIRRVYSARTQRSIKVRAPQDIELLRREGDRIAIIEAEGPLFFGTADLIDLQIESVEQDADWLIVDLKRVRDIDPTGARTLLQASRKVRNHGKDLIFSGANNEIESFLKSMGLETTVPPDNWATDIDRAIEEAEDRLLVLQSGILGHRPVTLAETELAKGLREEQVEILDRFVLKQEFAQTGRIFSNGDTGDSLFVASRSAVDILIPLQSGKMKRVASFAPGVFFGEMALLEGKPRSANAEVQGPSTLWELTRESLACLEREHPEIACQVLRNLSRNLADRLRSTTEELRMLAEGN